MDSSVPVKQERILQHDAELAAQVVQIYFANVDAVEQNLAALNVVEAQQQLNDRGLAGAGVADDGERLAGFDAEGNVAQDPIFVLGCRAAVIGEPDVAEFDFAARSVKGVRLLGFGDGERLVEQG